MAGAIERERRYEARGLAAADHVADDLYCQSAAMQALMPLLERAATMRAGVIVRGEEGTGRQVAARAIHAMQNNGGPFVTVDCASPDLDDLDRHLFGHMPRSHAAESSARGLETFCYMTIGTGIGGGAVVRGEISHGLLHPEFGHMRIPHDRGRDPFAGCCPYHGDCFEGLASGEALRARFGIPADELSVADAWALEADYIALGLMNVVCTLSPQRIILGGGVMKAPGLLSLVRAQVRTLAGDYFDTPALGEGIVDYVVSPALGDRAGVIGALELARISFASDEDRVPSSARL